MEMLSKSISKALLQSSPLIQRGFEYIHSKRPDSVVAYINALYSNINKFSSANTNMSENDAMRFLSDIQFPITNIPAQIFAEAIREYRSMTINHWKYSVKRGPAGAPWFFINNIDLAINSDVRISLDDWRQILNPLFGIYKGGPQSEIPMISKTKKHKQTKMTKTIAAHRLAALLLSYRNDE